MEIQRKCAKTVWKLGKKSFDKNGPTAVSFWEQTALHGIGGTLAQKNKKKNGASVVKWFTEKQLPCIVGMPYVLHFVRMSGRARRC